MSQGQLPSDRSWKMFHGTPAMDSTNKLRISAYRSDMVPFFVAVELNGDHDADRICKAISILESFRTCDCINGAYCVKHEGMLKGDNEPR